MLLAIVCMTASALSVLYTSLQPVPKAPIDAVHTWQDTHGILLDAYVPQCCTALIAVSAAFLAYSDLAKFCKVFRNVYAPAMLFKAIVGAVTLIPDADPRCRGPYDPYTCLTRNDMMPSGHMILATSVACLSNFAIFESALACVVGATLVLAKTHFTADVLVSTVLTVLLYKVSI